MQSLLRHQISWHKLDANNKLLKAVQSGVLDARFYAELADRFYTQTHIYSDTSLFAYGGLYGTNLLRMFCNNYNYDLNTPCEKLIAYLIINFNDSNMLQCLHKINENRKSIYLGYVVKEAVKTVYFFNMRPFVSGETIVFYSDFDGISKIQNLKENHNWKLYYYIQGEHDFE